jgi:hypothetical protein
MSDCCSNSSSTVLSTESSSTSEQSKTGLIESSNDLVSSVNNYYSDMEKINSNLKKSFQNQKETRNSIEDLKLRLFLKYFGVDVEFFLQEAFTRKGLRKVNNE